jgi:hypothetical protein
MANGGLAIDASSAGLNIAKAFPCFASRRSFLPSGRCLNILSHLVFVH